MLFLIIDTLSWITISFLSGALILTIFYYYLYYLNKTKYLKLWFLSWITLAFAYLFLLLFFLIEIEFLYGIYALLVTGYAYIFYCASSEFLKFKSSKKLSYILFIILLVMLIFTPIHVLLPWTIPIAFTTTSIIFVIVGTHFVSKNEFLKKFTGIIIIIFSVVSFFYPYIALYEWFTPWGYMGLGTIGMFMGISLIQIHFQDQRKELINIHDKLNYLAHHDSLTKLKNRLSMNAILDSINEEKTINVGLLFIDLNNFKQINDEYGHQVGDNTLVTISTYLKDLIKDSGYICRLGGDEFVVIMKNSSIEKTNDLNDLILNKGESHVFQDIKLDFAVGWAFKSEADQDIYTLLNDAEKKMYETKEKQKNNQ